MTEATAQAACVRPPAPDKYPCPACGFLSFDEPAGSYEICSICDWEDDAVQLANPASRGGANGESLVEAQSAILRELGMHVRSVNGIERDWWWRPVSAGELDEADTQARAKHWAHPATQQYYWRDGSFGLGNRAHDA